jgi:hypothetical protein
LRLRCRGWGVEVEVFKLRGKGFVDFFVVAIFDAVSFLVGAR